jgi:hypothetical protein
VITKSAPGLVKILDSGLAKLPIAARTGPTINQLIALIARAISRRLSPTGAHVHTA